MLKRVNSTTRVASSRIVCFAAVLAALVVAPIRAEAASLVHVQWEGLPTKVVGKTVSIAMPGGPVIKGKATGVESDALLVDVQSTTDAKAYPKGLARVPRATLRRFEMRTKGKAFRVLGTVLGSAAGLVAGVAAAWGIQGGVLGNKHGGPAAAAFCGIWAGGTIAGYFGGNAADKRWTPVEIVQ
jgi:hypothetical protein